MQAKPALYFALALVVALAAGSYFGGLQTSEAPVSSSSAALETQSPAGAGTLARADAEVETSPSAVELGTADSGPPLAVDIAKRHPSERPLQAFSGRSLDGEQLRISNFIGKRLILYFFNPEVPEADLTADAIVRVAKLRGKHNFTMIGVAVGSSGVKAREFAKTKGLDFPIFDDSSGKISEQLGLRNPVGIYGFDEEAYFDFGMGYFSRDVPDPSGVVEDQLRENLRLPKRPTGTAGLLDTRPQAPMFTTNELDSDTPFDFASLNGKPKVLIFFLHTCPHCHAALEFLKAQLAKMPADKRPEVIAVSAANRPSAVRAMIKERDLDDVRVFFDPEGDVMEAYGVFAGFPDVFMIDAGGKIVHRTQGWREDRDPALNRMMLAKIAGTKIPMLLNRRGYTGSDVCSVCHELEAQSYAFTQHATAYDTIVTHGKTRDAECVSCHVVGFEKPGGYSFNESPAHLENVGCESCHGRGGPHLSPDFVPTEGAGSKAKNYETVCQTCHNPTHSIGFDYDEFRPRISHVAIATMTNEQRAELVGDSDKPRDILPKNADYVGSSACQSCHPSEFKTWSTSPHSRAVDSLVAKGKADDATCLACHTTGMGRSGGFPKDTSGTAADHADLASVGCESCHGPGGNHIAPEAKKLGTIVSLADKCDSCAILQICGSCHDEANDPGFDFEVEEKIEIQRHGTIEAGTGKPLPSKPSAHIAPGRRAVRNESASAEADVAHVLRLLAPAG
ncbi:MAG: peroxiredoxin [Myxococcota bacterium]|jgi:peroxiredoxin